MATRTDKGIILAEELLVWLRQNNVIITAIDVVERTCAEAMAGGDKIVFQPLNAPLTPAHRDALDRLLESSDNQYSRLTWLLQPPGKINGKNVLQHLDRLSSIESLALPEGIDRTIHQNRLLKLAREGSKDEQPGFDPIFSSPASCDPGVRAGRSPGHTDRRSD